MKNILDILGKKVVIGDGAMGTLLQNQLSGNFIPEELNLSNKTLIKSIHTEYADAGADFLTTNTFGATRRKLSGVLLDDKFKKINSEAVKIAREVADKKGLLVAGDIGPCGEMIDPLGELTFQEASEIYGEQAKILENSGADFILLETITDIQEFRSAVVGISDSIKKIPLISSFSFTNGDLSVSGTPADVFAVTSGFIFNSAVGANCGTTLENMGNIIKKILRYTDKPVLCQPNAGLPEVKEGKTVFNVGPLEFADFMGEMYESGVSVIGSCCGSTPDFTRELSKRFGGKEVLSRTVYSGLALTSGTHIKRVSAKKIFLVGERINPTGRKKLRREISSGKLTTLRADAMEQEEKGSDALDVNVNLHRLEESVVKNIVKSIQNMVRIPLFIDTTDVNVVEAFCRLYRGKGVINSISGEEEDLKNILPLAKKYNMAFVAALIDDRGIPENSDERVKIGEKILSEAVKMGIRKSDIIFDPLVISAGSERNASEVTIRTIKKLKERFPDNMTIAGISNVSYGLPSREIINPVFLAMASGAGLDMVIANPLSTSLRRTLKTVNLLKNSSAEMVSEFAEEFSESGRESIDSPGPAREETGDLKEDIIFGDAGSAGKNVDILLRDRSAMDIIREYIIPAMNDVGERYRKGIFYLPHLIASADTVKAILPKIKLKLPRQDEDNRIKILFATVKGDIHDIGKNILISILESFNFKVIDIGKNIPPEKIIDEAISNGVDVIALSTLMTTTLPALLKTVKLIKKNEILKKVKVFIGGAVVTKSMAKELNVNFTRDGMEMVKMLKRLFR